MIYKRGIHSVTDACVDRTEAPFQRLRNPCKALGDCPIDCIVHHMHRGANIKYVLRWCCSHRPTTALMTGKKIFPNVLLPTKRAWHERRSKTNAYLHEDDKKRGSLSRKGANEDQIEKVKCQTNRADTVITIKPHRHYSRSKQKTH